MFSSSVTETQLKGQILVAGPAICAADNSNLFADVIKMYTLFDFMSAVSSLSWVNIL